MKAMKGSAAKKIGFMAKGKAGKVNNKAKGKMATGKAGKVNNKFGGKKGY